MSTRMMVLLLALALVPAARADLHGRGACIYVPIGFEYEHEQPPVGPEEPDNWEAHARCVLGAYYGINDADIEADVQMHVTDGSLYHRCTYEWLKEKMQNRNLYVINSHGAYGLYGRAFELESFRSYGACVARCNQLVSTYGFTHGYSEGSDIWRYPLEEGTTHERWVIFITPTGVANHLAPYASSWFMLLAYYCFSGTWAYAWLGGQPGVIDCPSMLGFDEDVDLRDSAHSYFTAVNTLGCELFSSEGRRSCVGDIPLPTSGDPVILGWRENGIEPYGRGCWNLAGRWLHASAYCGEVRMACVSEDSASTYFVIADGDTVSQFAGRGTDGYGRLRCYSVAVPPGASAFTCLEVDGLGRRTYSDWFTWQAESGIWEDLEPLDDMTMEEVEAQPWPRWEPDPWSEDDPRWAWVAACSTWADTTDHHWETLENGVTKLILDGFADNCSECADVVYYINRGIGDEYLLAESIAYQMSCDFPDLVPAVFIGPAPVIPQYWLIHAILEDVIEANAAYNAQYQTHYPVDPGPTLVLAGTGGGLISTIPFPDPPFQSCNSATCYSYNSYADVFPTGALDGLPDCPVTVMPAGSVPEAITTLIYASEWNQGQHVNSAGKGLFLLGDYDPGTHAQNHVLDGPMLRIRDMYYATPGIEAGPLLRAAEYYIPGQSPWPGFAVLENALAEGVRDIWAYGFETSAWRLPFLSNGYFDNGYGLDTDQVVMVFAPCCETGHECSQPLCMSSRLLFQDPDKTRAAGFLGQLNGDWDGAHLDFAQVFRNELGNSPEGTRFDIITHNAVRTIQEQRPHYGRGVVWLGALTKLRGAFAPSTSVDEEERGRPRPEGGLQVLRGASQVELRFSLARDTDVALNIFDSSGRLVSRIKNGPLSAGAYTYTWFMRDGRGRPAAAGIYFARLEIGSEGPAHTERVLVVR